ncbi:hypothetical protein K5X82_10050 [Halosquirtibacter xylanolyticus]|nr:hypothetical protein K5X82_10050 [Prolixibacteraceae bacterium]
MRNKTILLISHKTNDANYPDGLTYYEQVKKWKMTGATLYSEKIVTIT